MKGTPFKTRRISPFMQATPGFGGGQIPIDPNAGEISGNPKRKAIEVDENANFTEEIKMAENVANFAPLAGEIIDAKNTVKDLIAGDYGGAALNAAGFAIPFVPGSVIKGGVKKVMDYIRRQPGAEEAMKKGEELMSGSKTAGQMSVKNPGAPTGVTPEWSKGAGRLNNPGKEGITTQIQGMVNQGKELDKMGYKASEMLNSKNIVFHGDPTKSGRVIVEVALPNGQTQMFYKSSGLAGKSGRGVGGTTEGMWQPFMGYSDEVPTGWAKNKAGDYVATGTTKANNWHVKSPDYENFYGSKSYRDIAGNLDKIAAEEGWDMTGQLLKSNK